MKKKIIFMIAAALVILISCVKDPSQFDFKKNTLYKGRVIEKSQHNPIPNVKVSVTDGIHVNASKVTKEDGCFELYVDFNTIDDKYLLYFECDGYATMTEELKGIGQEVYDYKDIVYYDNSNSSNWPKVTTADPYEITATSARCYGEIKYSGYAEITARGICWSVSHDPTIEDDHTSEGSGTGWFHNYISGLDVNTKYYVRAYAVNMHGIYYGKEKSFTTVSGLPTVRTKDITNITHNSATGGGNVTDDNGLTVTERGICWSTNAYPTIDGDHKASGSGLGEYTCNMSNLTLNTMYYVRAYAINNVGVSYGDQKVFQTGGGATVTTSPVTNITHNSAKCGGNVTNSGGMTVTERGICWSTNTYPTINNSHVSSGSGTGSFTATMTGLSPSTMYYVRAYAKNSTGTSYGEQVFFSTTSGGSSATVPTVTITSPTNITANSVKCGGNVTSDGGATVIQRGVCYGTSPNPTTANQIVTSGTGTGSFTCNITGLSASTMYYVRAYAINSEGVAYSAQKYFTTSSGGGNATTPTVTTSTPSNITTNSATCGGNVTSDGGANVTARGVCWSTSQNPTISGSHTTDGTGMGTFTSSITGLAENTTYYVRAYATNSKGTSYGSSFSFTTLSGSTATTPTVTTSAPSGITTNSATCGGNVTSDGGATVTQRGVCYSTSQNPTTSNSTVANGSGTGSFTCSLTGLSQNTTYYVRAYATNSQGTAYGAQMSFTTNNSSIAGWIHYDDGNTDDAVGLNNGGTLYWADMFPASVLSPYAGTSITKVKAALNMEGTYLLQIYQGGVSAPETMIYQYSYTHSNSAHDWYDIEFPTPILLDDTQSLWIVLSTTHSAGNYPAGICTNSGDIPNGRWASMGNGWSILENTSYTWGIHTYVTNQIKGEEPIKITITNNYGSNNNNDLLISSKNQYQKH